MEGEVNVSATEQEGAITATAAPLEGLASTTAPPVAGSVSVTRSHEETEAEFTTTAKFDAEGCPI